MRPISSKSSFLAISRFLTVLTLALAGLLTAASAQTPVTIHTFIFGTDVTVPTAPGIAVQGRDGSVYSTTDSGAANGAGGVYAVAPGGAERVVYSFPHSYAGCVTGLTLGTDGNFYGACSSHGTFGYGLIYRMTSTGTFTDLYEFNIASGGAGGPSAPPIQAKDGNFYGVTYRGGSNDTGTVYKLTPTGTLTILHSFTNTIGDGSTPVAMLVQGTDGNLYGSATAGGSGGGGVIFKISTTGKLTALHSLVFTDGSSPQAPMIQATDGSFYGTTFQGGTNNDGVIFKITASGKYTVLHNFVPTPNATYSLTAMMQGTDGNFYGTTNKYGDLGSYLYKVTSKGVFSIVYHFDGTNHAVGIATANALVQNTNGLFFGATSVSPTGGTGNGTLYTFDIGATPFVRLTLTAGKVASTVSLFGQGFSGSSVVKFGGVPAATVTLAGTTYITAIVPAGAHSGPVTVTTGATTLTSNLSYKVTPAITTFSPTTGPVGTSVVIHGSGLIQATTVKFGTIVASGFTVNSDSQITALVPAGSAPGQVKISITTPGGTATSSAKFTVQ